MLYALTNSGCYAVAPWVHRMWIGNRLSRNCFKLRRAAKPGRRRRKRPSLLTRASTKRRRAAASGSFRELPAHCGVVHNSGLSAVARDSSLYRCEFGGKTMRFALDCAVFHFPRPLHSNPHSPLRSQEPGEDLPNRGEPTSPSLFRCARKTDGPETGQPGGSENWRKGIARRRPRN